MPTDRPCDKDIVPDSCADTGGLVSVQLNVIVTIGRSTEIEIWHKNAVVFISRRDEFTFGSGEFEQAYIQKQSDNIMKDFKGCLTGQVDSYLNPSVNPPSPVSLTQVADCMSDQIAAPERLGAPPRGIFISQKNRRQVTSISANFAACGAPPHGREDQCIDAADQSFGQGHVIAHAWYRYIYEAQSQKGNKGLKSAFFFYAVLLPPRRPPGP